MRRRGLLASLGGAMLARPLMARAQQRPAMPVVGFLAASSAEAAAPFYAAFLGGLRESGHVDGRHVVVEQRWADGRHERLPALAAELVARGVAVIAATNSHAALAAYGATRTIPIVGLGGDLVALGLVASLSRPGGNVTGINVLTTELVPKRLELLRELIPGAKSVAIIVNPANPIAVSRLNDARAAAQATGHDVQVVEVRNEGEIERAFARLSERRPDALIVGADPLFIGQREQVIALAARHALPTIYDWPDFATAGGLVSYGPNLKDAMRVVGVYTGKILAGARPADLPVQQPTKFELVINLKTAKALGLTVPTTMLDRADEVIE